MQTYSKVACFVLRQGIYLISPPEQPSIKQITNVVRYLVAIYDKHNIVVAEERSYTYFVILKELTN